MKLKSDFAILDVKSGRKKLAKHFENDGGPILVTITGLISGEWGGDDGESIEFQVDVKKVEVVE